MDHRELGAAGTDVVVALGQAQQSICATDGVGAVWNRVISVLLPRLATTIPDRRSPNRSRFHGLPHAVGGTRAGVRSSDRRNRVGIPPAVTAAGIHGDGD